MEIRTNMEYIVVAAVSLIIAVFGFMLRRNAKLNDEARIHFEKQIIRLDKDIKVLERRLRGAISKDEARQLFEDLVKPMHVMLEEILTFVRKDR